MSQERVDVTLRFLNGQLAWQADVVRRGPTVRIGSNPGPDGLKLDGYRGVDDRHAVITAYTEASAQIAPVGHNQVRVADHEHVDWTTVHAIRGPVYLSNGCAVHLGPVGRGATFSFVKAERLGKDWKGGAVISEAAQAELGAASQVKELDIKRRIPVWFVPGLLFMTASFGAMLTLLVLFSGITEPPPLGPVSEDDVPPPEDIESSYGNVFEVKPDTRLFQGIDQAFGNFVMTPNIQKAPQFGSLSSAPTKWDKGLKDYVARAEKMYLSTWAFWKDLERAKDDYATVVRSLRAAGLPDVLAAVPYQETRYNAGAYDTLLCAAGMWQFQPETAKRYGISVKGCPFSDGGATAWEPTLLAPPMNAIKNADYVLNGHCRIRKGSCKLDERLDTARSTAAAVKSFSEVWNDPDLAASGAVVQAAIASHNCGYDDSRYRDGRISTTNIKHAYPKYKKTSQKTSGLTMFGDSIACSKKSDMKEFDRDNINNTCGSVLPNVTQTYVPQVIAQHLLAVCYYGKNYSDVSAFANYRTFTTGSGYCNNLKVPTADEVRNHRAAAK